MKKLTKFVLSEVGGKAVTRAEIDNFCKKFGENPDRILNYMISYGYLVRILRGVYYVKTLEEFKLNKSPDILTLIALGMEKIGIDWYFGLYTALRLNGITHEFYGTTFVLSDSLYRPKAIKIKEDDVKFVKLKSDLFGFGVVERGNLRFSDPEKTLLDIIYVSRYRSVPEKRILSTVEDYGAKITKKKIRAYLRAYPKSVGSVAKNAGII